MARILPFALGTALAMGVTAAALAAPESLLPPGFDRPKAAPAEPSGQSTPVVQPIPTGSNAERTPARAPTLPSGLKLPSLREIEAMSPDELDELLGLKPKYDMPVAARRSLKQIGLLGEAEGGLPSASLARQSPALVRAALTGNKGLVVSRWGHILLRRALASRLDAPEGMNPADFAALRAGLLLRMGEGEAARAIVQDIEAGNYTPALTQAAIDSYVMTADVTGICPTVQVQGSARKDADWRVMRAICSSFQGDGASGLAQLDRLTYSGAWPRIDMLLAQKYAGSAGKARRAVKIEWDGVDELTPWRYALSIAVGVKPPQALLDKAPLRYQLVTATAPMIGLDDRAAAADTAAALGLLSSAAMVDLYSQIYAQDDATGPWATQSETLRTAYVAENPDDRMGAMQTLWSGGGDPRARYSRQVLTAYAAARLPVASKYKAVTGDLITSMLTAGLDRNALRWADQVETGTLPWALLALARPDDQQVDPDALDTFYDEDNSQSYRRSRFLVAGLVGLGRLDRAAAAEFAFGLGVNLSRQTRWTRLIDQAADANNAALVALLAGAGMQGDSWERMTSVNLYHIVSALDRVGLSAEARMIAAEAVARG